MSTRLKISEYSICLQGYTALHLAAMQGHNEIMTVLEEAYGKYNVSRYIYVLKTTYS